MKDILVVGGGSIGKRHIENLLKLGAGRVTCLRRSDDGELQRKYGITVATSWDQAAPGRFDAMIVCTPTSLHGDAIGRAVAAGCPVLVEKPLVGTPEEFEAVSGLLEGYRGVFYLGYMLRQHPLLRQIKGLLDSGALGAPFHGRFEFGSHLPEWHPWEDYRTSYASRPELGGGVINTISHETDLALYLFGAPEAVYTRTSGSRILGLDVEESADSLLEFAGATVHVHVDYLQRTYHRSLAVCCEKGRIDWTWGENRATVKEAGRPPRELSMPPLEVNDLYVAELEEFLALAAGGIADHPLGARYALENTRVIMAMKRSAAAKERIKL